jgi:hypothetical protein
MRALLAHQGGWDEILLPVGLVLGMLGLSRWRRRTRTPSDAAPPEPVPGENVCAYCGTSLAPDDERCPSCGFRTRAGS